jgi:hypothetical protein
MSANDIGRIKNIARFWEIIVNRRLIEIKEKKKKKKKFMALSDSLFAHFGRNWGIDKYELLEALNNRRSFNTKLI